MKKGILLIELLIGIIIFGLVFVLLIVIISRSILNLDRVRNYTIGTFLAQESLEIMLSHIDTNNLKYLNWNCHKSSLECNQFFEFGKYKVGFDIQNNYYIEKGNNDFVLYYSGHYNYLTGEKTNFSRYVIITGYQIDGVLLDTGYVLKVISNVDYKNRFKITLETLIGDK